MATSVMQRQKTGSWSAIFPTEQVTQQQSALFVKKLLAVAISNITYLRTIFPEHAFGDRCLEDLNLKILRDDSACPGACQVIQWVKGCFDALDRKYLRMIVVGIYADNTEPLTAVETYTFKFDYNDQKGITIFRNDTQVTSAYTETETKRATIKLLRTIIVLTQTLQPLPDDVMMTMKLCYYDDVTPEDYEPPGFQHTNSDDFVFEDNPVTIRVGDVNTPFHAVKLRIKTKRAQFSGVDGEDMAAAEEGNRNCDSTEQHLDGSIPRDGKTQASSRDDLEGGKNDIIADTGQAKGVAHEPTRLEHGRLEHGQNHEDRKNSKQKMDVEEEARDDMEGDEGESQITPSLDDSDEDKNGTAEDNTVWCPCGIYEDDGLMVLCGVCQVWQHAVCYCLLKEKDVPDLHICVACSKKGRGTCTDSSLVTLNKTRLQNICLWRRTLHACMELTRVIPSGLARRLGVSVTAAQGIIERLEHEGYIRPAGKSKRLGRAVIKEKILEEAVPKHLTLPAKQNRNTSSSSKKQSAVDRDSKGMQLSKPHPPVSGVDSLAQKASHLNITAAASDHVPEKLVEPPKSALTRKQFPRGNLMDVENCEVRRSPRILAKRVRSVVDESQEFEVSCSQETQQQEEVALEEGRARKRRKASIASHAIMV